MFWIILLILLSFCLILSLIILVIPLRLIIHSAKNDYRLEWGRIVSSQYIPLQDDPRLVLKIFLWKKEWNLWQMLTKDQKEDKPETPPKQEKKRKKKSWRSKKNFQRFKKIIGSLQVKTFRLRLDTDNYVLNAYLYPLFYFLNLGSKDWEINFQGETELDLYMEARPIRVLWALIH